MTKKGFIILLIILNLLYIGIGALARSNKMILCYYAGNPYAFNYYKCELVARGQGY